MLKLHSIYDNGGDTLDRYTINMVCTIDKSQSCWGASERPSHPTGFGCYVGDYHFEPDGEAKIELKEAPQGVQDYIKYLES